MSNQQVCTLCRAVNKVAGVFSVNLPEGMKGHTAITCGFCGCQFEPLEVHEAKVKSAQGASKEPEVWG